MKFGFIAFPGAILAIGRVDIGNLPPEPCPPMAQKPVRARDCLSPPAQLSLITLRLASSATPKARRPTGQ